MNRQRMWVLPEYKKKREREKGQGSYSEFLLQKHQGGEKEKLVGKSGVEE